MFASLLIPVERLEILKEFFSRTGTSSVLDASLHSKYTANVLLSGIKPLQTGDRCDNIQVSIHSSDHDSSTTTSNEHVREMVKLLLEDF